MSSIAVAVMLGCVFLLVPLTAMFFYAYIAVVAPTLSRHGLPAVWPTRPGEFEEQVRSYGKLCGEHGYSLGWYRFMVTGRRAMMGLVWIMAIAMIGNWWVSRGGPGHP